MAAVDPRIAELAAQPAFPPSPAETRPASTVAPSIQYAAPAPVPVPAIVNPYPAPPQFDSVEPNLNEHDRPLRLWKLGIRITAGVSVALSLILLIAYGAQWQSRDGRCYRSSYYCYNDYADWHNGYDPVSIPILAFAMTWNSAEFITYCVNKRGSHPAVQVTFDLLSWGSLISIALGNLFGWGYAGRRAPLQWSAFVLCLVAAILHFVTFVMACVATHRRRHLLQKHLIALQSKIAAWQATCQAIAAHYAQPQYFQPQYPTQNGKPEVSQPPQANAPVSPGPPYPPAQAQV